jgi:hypothetical protein
MTLKELKNNLSNLKEIGFVLPNGTFVPPYFHVTEVGKITREFIDCGGTERSTSMVNFQLWTANDFDHRLSPEKLLKIIDLANSKFKLNELEIEVEYQSDTIGKYGLEFDGINFNLKAKQTDCLAIEACGIPEVKTKKSLENLAPAGNSCAPGSGCC